MKYCLINLSLIKKDEEYNPSSLKKLSAKLIKLKSLNYTVAEQQEQALQRIGKMSIQGVQPKLSAVLNIKGSQFDIVDRGGKYIIKIQSPLYKELPQNESLSMLLAKSIDIETPLFGLVKTIDNNYSYFIKRFDREGRNKKIAVEDFCQLASLDRDTKYNSSMEQVITIIDKYSTFPSVERVKLFRLTLFNFLIGNEDMHLKNFSLITKDNITRLAPAYDLLNTSIALINPKEELALPLKGKKRNLQAKDFFNYFAMERLALNQPTIDQIKNKIITQLPLWLEMIEHSFLSRDLKMCYQKLLIERFSRLGLS